MITLNDDSFQSKIDESKILAICFKAVWCQPCKNLAPVLAELADMYSAELDFAIIDVDTNPQATVHFEVRGLPTILLIKEGKVIKSLTGAQPRPKLEKEIRNFVEANS